MVLSCSCSRKDFNHEAAKKAMNTINKLRMFHMAVKDMDKLKEFYTEKLGFKVTSDFAYDKAQAAQAGVPAGSRWISMEFPGGGTSMNLTKVLKTGS